MGLRGDREPYCRVEVKCTFNCFKVSDSGAVNAFPVLGNCHQCLIPEYVHLPKRTPVPICNEWQEWGLLPFRPQATTGFLSVSGHQPILDFSVEGTHGLWSPTNAFSRSARRSQVRPRGSWESGLCSLPWLWVQATPQLSTHRFMGIWVVSTSWLL